MSATSTDSVRLMQDQPKQPAVLYCAVLCCTGQGSVAICSACLRFGWHVTDSRSTCSVGTDTACFANAGAGTGNAPTLVIAIAVSAANAVDAAACCCVCYNKLRIT